MNTTDAKQYKVAVHYTGSLDDGSIFDSSKGREPLEFIQGAQQVVPGFDKAVASLEPGESTTVRLEPSEAYGEHNPELIQELPKDQIPNVEELSEGQTVYFQSPEGYPFPARVDSITEEAVRFDMNHELAGKALTFEIELISREDLDA